MFSRQDPGSIASEMVRPSNQREMEELDHNTVKSLPPRTQLFVCPAASPLFTAMLHVADA